MQLDLVDGVAPPDELALEEATTMVVTFFGFDGTTGLVFDAFFVGVNAFFTPPVPPASPVLWVGSPSCAVSFFLIKHLSTCRSNMYGTAAPLQ